jgi:transcriptional regulator with XRE-family HTH domain
MTKPKTRAPGEILRGIRIGLGLSLEKVAAMAGISYAFIQGIESGRFRGSLVTKLKICNALDLGLKQIWPGTCEELFELEGLQEADRRRSGAITTSDLGPDLKLTPEARRRRLVEGD